jgi:basic membrane lipoprotein Med (substrate-binding protein (PBP1-ABC) superfamily)
MATEEPVEEPTEEPTEEPAEEPVLIAFGHVGPVSDEGWTWSHDQGMKAIEEQFGDRIETTYVESMPFSDESTRTLEQFVADGAEMVFITSEYADFLYPVAESHPDVAFLECDGHKITDNLSWYYVEHWDPSYLIGMAAGLMTESDKLGYVGSFPIESVYGSVNSFHLGARSVNPDVTTQVVLINSWFDPAAANQAANTLIDGGADFLFGIMDEAAYLEVAEERGVWAAMWNTDMRRFGPEAYVSSVVLDWNDYYIEQVGALLNDAWEPKAELLPIARGVDRDEWGKNVPQDVRDQVDEVRDRMINEDLNVFVGPIYDTEGELRIEEGEELTPMELYRWDWAVEGVSGMP